MLRTSHQSEESRKKISESMHKRKAVWIDFNGVYKCTTKQLAEEYGIQSSNVATMIRKYGYVILDGKKYKASIMLNP